MFAALVLATGPASAQRSYFRMYDQDYGLDVGEIVALAQDRAGFLWIGAHRGLIRFDGRNFVLWDQEQVDEVVAQIIYGPDDDLLIRTAAGRGFRRTGRGLEALAGPDGKPLTSLAAFDYSADGSLWAIVDARLWQRGGDQRWSPIDHGIPMQEEPARVFALGEDIVVLTGDAAWRLRGSEGAQRLLEAKDLWFAAKDATGSIWLATHFNHGLWRIDAAGVHAVERRSARALDLRARGGTIWLSLDRELVAFEADGTQRRIGIAEGLPSGGPLLVDNENSLWLGTFVGLVQFPEPDTWQWGEGEGLPLAHVYAINEYEGTVFASTWGGLAHIDERPGQSFTADPGTPFGGAICVIDGLGVWASDRDHLLEWRGDHFERVSDLVPSALVDSCAVDGERALWIATTRGLLRKAADARVARAITVLPTGAVDEIWLDPGGDLRVLADTSICRLRIVSMDVAQREDCHPVKPVLVPNSIAPVAPGRIWIAANNGIFEFDGAQARRLPGNHLLAGGIIQSLTSTSDDDWWAAGAGALLRVHDCGDCEPGWQVRETPGQWQGIPGNSAMQARETRDGALWIAGNRGVWRVPKAARAPPSRAPNVVAVKASIDGTEHRLDSALELPAAARRLELEFAALSFRDRTLLRFRSQLGAGGWSAPSRSPILQFAAVEPGSYRAQMAASLDSEHWSDAPAAIDFVVLPPWYRTWWARVLFVFAAFALLAVLYRVRVAALLRVERERTRIAMDLHDELGTGLGSIGMLAGVAAREGLDSTEQRRLVREIANLSGLLGSGLRSLVWSLRSGRAGLAELGAQLADHARRLFPGDLPALSVQLPVDAAAMPLAPELRRHVLLLALESLHNVARHAQATRVTLALEAIGTGLKLSVTDDGRGFDPDSESIGAGLESMRRRAAAIGAALDIASAPGQGTRVVLIWTGAERIA